jgi:hypothetical protein
MRTLLALVAVSLVPAIAHADQCALIDLKVADAAKALAKPGVRALELCEPCGDKAPGAPFTIKTAVFRGHQLAINGKLVDLAYVYVENGPKEMKNLGLAAGCSPSGVSSFVRDGKPSGPVTRRPAGKPPLPPSPYGSSPSRMPRATSPDELVGTWTVKVTTWLSSCALKPRPDETWFIDLTGGAFAITTDTLTFEGAPAPLTHGSFTHSLKTKQMPSSTVLKLTHSMKDRFHGTIVRAEPSGGPNDPVCVMQLNISGSRQP